MPPACTALAACEQHISQFTGNSVSQLSLAHPHRPLAASPTLTMNFCLKRAGLETEIVLRKQALLLWSTALRGVCNRLRRPKASVPRRGGRARTQATA